MSVDRSLRSTFAAILLVAALFLVMNRIVASAPVGDWFLPLALFIIGAALVPNWNFSRSQPEADAKTEELEEIEAFGLPGEVHTYRVAAQQVPRLQTMTIRPDPEATDTVVTITEDTAGDVLPFIETETAPSVTAPATPSVTSTPAAVQNTPAPAPSATSHNEAADPEVVVAKTEAPVAPAPDESVTATPRTEPEKEVIAEKTAAPQQPYEAAQVGEITPERVDQVMNDSPTAESPLVSETASPAITADMNGEGTVGSADDLVKLNGIGPKLAAALKAAGIDSFHKLANSSEDQLRAAVAGVRMVGDVTTWARQASYAAQGDWAGLNEFNASQRKTGNGD